MITKEFLTAGSAVFTVENGPHHLTYRVQVPERARSYANQMCFLAIMSGSDNEADYSYIGRFFSRDGQLKATNASKFDDDSLTFRIAQNILDIIYGRKQAKRGTDIRHSGKCGRCGRTLTEPESLDSGIGPECKKRQGQPRTRQAFRRFAGRGRRFGSAGQGHTNLAQRLRDESEDENVDLEIGLARDARENE